MKKIFLFVLISTFIAGVSTPLTARAQSSEAGQIQTMLQIIANLRAQISLLSSSQSASQSQSSTPPPPNSSNIRLSISPSSISRGNTATITWNATGVTRCNSNDIPGIATYGPISGTATVSPTATKTYTIICYTASGASSRASVSISVSGLSNTGGSSGGLFSGSGGTSGGTSGGSNTSGLAPGLLAPGVSAPVPSGPGFVIGGGFNEYANPPANFDYNLTHSGQVFLRPASAGASTASGQGTITRNAVSGTQGVVTLYTQDTCDANGGAIQGHHTEGTLCFGVMDYVTREVTYPIRYRISNATCAAPCTSTVTFDSTEVPSPLHGLQRLIVFKGTPGNATTILSVTLTGSLGRQ